jgi:hypothetical protein
MTRAEQCHAAILRAAAAIGNAGTQSGQHDQMLTALDALADAVTLLAVETFGDVGEPEEDTTTTD